MPTSDYTQTVTAVADHVYRLWVTGRSTGTTASTTISTCGTDRAWSIWNGTGNSCGTITNTTVTYLNAATDRVWLKWATEPERLARGRIEHVYTPPPPPTPEQVAERARILEAARVADAEARAKREAATKRARGLLLSHLTREQRDSYERHGHFDVLVDGKTYRIKQGTHGNVALVDAAGVIERYCAQPDGVPTEDAMLAQLLSLRFAPQEFFNKANRTRVRN